MKKLILLALSVCLAHLVIAEEIVTLRDGRQIVVYDDFTWGYLTTDLVGQVDYSTIRDNEIPSFLRQGIQADRNQIIQAIRMYEQGWLYTMPRPKSTQAAWGNSDGRTTWYNGWWHNEATGHYSVTTPIERESGLFLGDNQNSSNTWRNGGSPRSPDVYMWLLSESGGPRR
ncbi:MAG: DUF3157 family protein [Spirochaetaceae bacterium]|nr:DUF3157 family protein [Spirochaetaceae bacterium]